MKNASKKHYSAYEHEYLGWYKSRSGVPFNPNPLVQAAKEQWADRPDLIHALAKCTVQWPEGTEGWYTHFYDRSQYKYWRRAGGRGLECPVHGELLIDLRARVNNPNQVEIAGIEFLDKVLGRDRTKTKGFVIAANGTAKEIPPVQAPMRVVWVK